MSVTEATIHSATPSGAMPELVAGLAVIVLTILGLAGVAPNFLVAIATIVFGVGLLLFGASEVASSQPLLVSARGRQRRCGPRVERLVDDLPRRAGRNRAGNSRAARSRDDDGLWRLRSSHLAGHCF